MVCFLAGTPFTQFSQERSSHNLVENPRDNGWRDRRAGVAKIDFPAPSVSGPGDSHDGNLEAAG